MEYVDTHAHLPLLEHDPSSEILTRAREKFVTRIISVSTEENNWELNRQFSLREANVYYSLGLHPHQAVEWPRCAQKLFDNFQLGIPQKCVAIGEIGLDFHYKYSPVEIQTDVFETQLNLGKLHNLPVIIHCREAFDTVFESIRKVGLSSRGGVMHCFTGTEKEAKIAVDLGLKISFSGILTFKNANSIRQAAKSVPLNDLLIETDCPYLTPAPFRGKPNEPSYLPLTGQQLAAVRGMREEEIADRTTQNALEFFQIP